MVLLVMRIDRYIFNDNGKYKSKQEFNAAVQAKFEEFKKVFIKCL